MLDASADNVIPAPPMMLLNCKVCVLALSNTPLPAPKLLAPVMATAPPTDNALFSNFSVVLLYTK